MILRFMRPDGSDKRDIIAFLGGQGTINVNSCPPTAAALPMSPIRWTAKQSSRASGTPAPVPA
ncbi:MAG: hypothetical protein MO846_08920 [Candidatus Devosia symbiotica]|nr:hypothetical protein [Candidatus Devosia symbiotica]